ncbi:hypothetical protein [Acinetobacter puyangensis]|uniref:hypothetical protein n=1 Tax=Acinetobacter puyangensis TaxID=1096779 RepID=UPI003A4E3C5C
MNTIAKYQENISFENLSNPQKLIMSLKSMYASQFAKHLETMPSQVFEGIVSAALIGVSDADFNKGLARLLSGQNKFMPTVQEFKSWCVTGNWWTSAEAWHHACEASKQPKHKITVITKQCWDEVYHIVLDGNMREAQRQFTNLYEDRVTRAQLQGAKQEAYVAPVAIPVKTSQQNYKSLNSNQDPEYLEEVKRLTQKYCAAGMSIVQAGIRAAKELRGAA